MFWKKAVKGRQLNAIERIRIFGGKMTQTAIFFQNLSTKMLKKHVVLHSKIGFVAKKMRWRSAIENGLNKLRALAVVKDRLDLFSGFYNLFGNSLAQVFTGKNLPKNFTVTIVRQRAVTTQKNLNFSVFNQQLGNVGDHLGEINLSKILDSFNQNMQIFLQNITVKNSKIIEVSSVVKEKRGSGMMGESICRSDIIATRYDPGVYFNVIKEEGDPKDSGVEDTTAYEVFTSDNESEKKMVSISVLVSEKETRNDSGFEKRWKNPSVTGRKNLQSLSESKNRPRKVSQGSGEPMMPLKKDSRWDSVWKRSEGGALKQRLISYPEPEGLSQKEPMAESGAVPAGTINFKSV
jgi:hypothetical protein